MPQIKPMNTIPFKSRAVLKQQLGKIFQAAVLFLFFNMAAGDAFAEAAVPSPELSQEEKEQEIIRIATEEIEKLEDETAQLISIMDEHSEFLEESPTDRYQGDRMRLELLEEKVDKLKEISKEQEEIISGKEKTLHDLKKQLAVLEPRSAENSILQEENKRLKTELGNAYRRLGVMYMQKKHFKEAVQAYEQSIFFAPEEAKTYYHLGLLYEYERGDSKEAIAQFKQYLKLDPHASNRKRVESLIEMLEK